MTAYPQNAQTFRGVCNADNESIVTPRNSPKNAQDGTKHRTKMEWLNKISVPNLACSYCDTPLTRETVTKDHRVPLCRGGLDTIANIVPACLPCNQSKTWRTEREFLREKYRLSTGAAIRGGKSKPKPFVKAGEITYAHTLHILPPQFPMHTPLEETDEPGLMLRLIKERDGGVSWDWRNPLGGKQYSRRRA